MVAIGDRVNTLMGPGKVTERVIGRGVAVNLDTGGALILTEAELARGGVRVEPETDARDAPSLRRDPLEIGLLCAFVGIPADKAPPEWANHSNGSTMRAWRRVADYARALAQQAAP